MSEVAIYNTSEVNEELETNMKQKPVSSRLIRREKNKLVKQTVLGVVFSIVILLLFLFFGLPNAPRIVGLLAGQEGNFAVNDDIPPQVPVIYLTERDVNLAKFTVQGFTEADSQVIVIYNGQELEPIKADSAGAFELELGLSEGENTIAAVSVDQAENRSAQSKTETVNLDTEVPELTFAEGIVDGMNIIGKDKQTFILSGQTEPSAKITINDRFLFAKADGSFSYSYRLQEGDNQLKIQVDDKAGNQLVKNLKLVFKP